MKKLFNIFQDNFDFSEQDQELKLNEISDRDIAITGMSVKMPLAENVHDFWKNIRNQINCIRDIPDSRRQDIDSIPVFNEGTKPNYLKMGYIDNIDRFDWEFFKMSPKEAKLMDPNHRVFLQTAWEAVEDAGYGGEKLRGSKTGVFVGYSGPSIYRNLIEMLEPESMDIATPGNLDATIPGRVSYTLDLKGPSMIVNTACSSSLVAVALACQSIRSKTCSMAIAGGIKLFMLPLRNDHRLGIVSSDGYTKAFDDSSDGTGDGEGVGAVVLKPLKTALIEGDNIYAVIKGFAMNQDGASMGLTAPSPAAQEDLIVSAWKDAGIDPQSISYIETHGTGTKLGDPVEISGIKGAFSRFTDKKQFCAIGSIKTNIGHLDNAAGIAGLVKSVLMLKNQEIPANLHFKNPNRNICFENSAVYINDRHVKWNTDAIPRRCGVSSFGLSGTNCHIILEEFITKDKSPEERNHQILTLSAVSHKTLIHLVKNYNEFILNEKPNISNLCFTANTGRGHYDYRLAIIFKDQEDIRHKLSNIMINGTDSCLEDVFYGRCGRAGNIIHNDDNISRRTTLELAEEATEIITLMHNQLTEGYNNLLPKLCELYVSGAEIAWDMLYSQENQRICVPVYPFASNRCWLDTQRVTDFKNIFYCVNWKKADMDLFSPHVTCPETILVLHNNPVKCEELTERLHITFKSKVIKVQFGDQFNMIDDSNFIIGHSQIDFDNLVEQLKIRKITTIVQMAGEEEINNNKLSSLDDMQIEGLYSQYYLINALWKSKMMHEISVFLVAYNVNEVTKQEKFLNPGSSTLFGFAKAVGYEYPNIFCRCVDMDMETSMDLLINEMRLKSGPYMVAYRGGNRYTEILCPADTHTGSGKGIQLKDGGTYVITGGTGGIGLDLCKYLADANQVNLVLISRSIPPREVWNKYLDQEENNKTKEIILTLISVEATGSTISVYQADVSDYKTMSQIYNQIKEKFISVTGIFHCAGVAGNGMIINKEEMQLKDVLAPKVQGTWVLDKISENDNLDFLVLFSSIASVVGGPGQSDYSAANSYLDSFASFRNHQGKKTITVNWTTWESTGMARNSKVDGDRLLMRPIKAQNALEALETLLKTENVRVVVGELNLNEALKLMDSGHMQLSEKIIDFYRKSNCMNPKSIVKEKKINNISLEGGDGGYTEIQVKLSEIWLKVLEVDIKSIYESFEEYGGNSIIAVHMYEAINNEYPGKIELSDIFTYPTIDQMAKELQKRIDENKSESSIDKILHMLEDGDMSVEKAVNLMESVDDSEWNS